MRPANRPIGAVAAINIKAAAASVCTILAWHLWPDGVRDLHFAPISIFLGIMGAALFIGSAAKAAKLYIREKAIRTYLSQGIRPKSASLAPGQSLRDAGMLDD